MTLPARNNILINQSHRIFYKDVIVDNPLKDYKNRVDDLIYTYRMYRDGMYYLDFFNISSSDQYELVALKMALDQNDNDMGDVFYQYNHAPAKENVITSLINMLKNPSKEEDYINCLKKHLINYYSEAIQEFIDDRCMQLESSDPYED